MHRFSLTAEEIHQHIVDTELNSRKLSEMGAYGDQIIRFGGFVGSSVECFPTLPRAMNYARMQINQIEQSGRSVRSGTLILAEELSGSKGRFERVWHAPKGGLWGCLVHADSLLPSSAMLLSLAVGVAACETLKHYGCPETSVRWVNDILIKKKKVAGFLIESHTGPVSKEQFHLIGFGLNINNETFPDELRYIATSLSMQMGRNIDLREIALLFIGKLAWNIGLLYFIESQDLHRERFLHHPVITRFKELTDTMGKEVNFGNDVLLDPQYQATVRDIGDDGGLQLELKDGRKITEYSGEIRYIE